jgi:polyhydroxybutyrate depolymerase
MHFGKFTLALSLTLMLLTGIAPAQPADPPMTEAVAPEDLTDLQLGGEEPNPSCKFNNQKGIRFVETLMVDGLVRKTIVHLPAGYRNSEQLPVVIVLHGAKLTGKILETVTGFDKLSNHENFIVAYPNAVYHQWNDGRAEGYTPAYGIDDVKYISSLMDTLIWKFNADPKRIYLTGFSSGGMMSMRLGRELTNRIAAIAPVSASFPIPALEQDVKPTLPLPVLMINGTHDQAFPWDGGDTKIVGVKVGPVAPVMTTVDYWVKANGGDSAAPEFQQCKHNRKDSTTVDVSYFSTPTKSCVLLFRVNGGGHTWPGSEVPLKYIPLLGRQNRDVSASELIWTFFKNYSRPEAPTLPVRTVTSPSPRQVSLK